MLPTSIKSQNFSKTETIDRSYETKTKLRKYVGGRNCTYIRSIPIGGQDVPCRDKENAGSGTVKSIYSSLIPSYGTSPTLEKTMGNENTIKN